MKNLQAWWRTRTLREQRLLLVMGALALLVLAWLLVIRPLGDALSEAKGRHGAAAIALAEARGLSEAIRAAEAGAPAALPMPLDSMISQAATEAGFTITRLDRHSSVQTSLVMDAVRPQAFFTWVAQMEARGLIVERLTATPNTDRTLAIQTTFRARNR